LEKPVATASTKRTRKKRPATAAAARKASASADAADPLDARRAPGDEIPERAWRVAAIVVLMLATGLRIYALDLKPLHHDEGVNGFFLTNLLRQGVYHYDPANYHGPTLYYLTLPVVALFGLSTFAIRFVPVLFGVGAVWLVLALRRRVGAIAALTAAALVAISPACVFYSRYFIHETPFVFFTLGLVVAALRFQETGAPLYLMLASASAAMLFATKETAFISIGTLAPAWLVAFAWVRLTTGGGRGTQARRSGGEASGFDETAGLAAFRASGQAPAFAAGAVALFVLIWVVFYSSFFTNWEGVFWDSFKAFSIWKGTGMSEFHGKPPYTYVKWLLQEESAILILGSVGAVVALFESRKNRFAVFAAAWGLGLLAAYSLISYKTPWLVLNFVVPLAIAGGYAVQAVGGWVARAGGRRGGGATQRRLAAMAVAAVAIGGGLYQTIVLNFREYDNDRYPYVYSQTQRQVYGLVKEIEQLGARARTKEPGFAVASPDYWPLPWYFRDNTHAGFEGRIASSYDPQATLAVIGKDDQLPQLQRLLGEGYVRVGDIYPLRPGVNLVLFERRDLAGK
jgi:uncharacterized protein (TIGR03663 family)